MGNDHCLKILAEFTSHMYVYIVVSFVWLDHIIIDWFDIYKKCINMLLREYDENCVTDRKIYCNDNIIVRYGFERQFNCETICVL